MNTSEPLKKPRTIAEVRQSCQTEHTDETDARVCVITEEFNRGFDFLATIDKVVSIFGSTRARQDDATYKQARDLAYRLAKEQDYAVVTGGGPGIMEAANRGASEAGGHSVGLTIELREGQVTNHFVTDRVDFHYFFSRKVMLSFAARMYIFFPGGYGTLDEFFEIIMLVQTYKIPHIPIVLVGSEYWQPLWDFIHSTVYEKYQAVDQEDLALVKIVDDLDEIMKIAAHAPKRHE